MCPGRKGRLPTTFFPGNADQQLEARFWDRFIDLYVHVPMQEFVADYLRPEGQRDPRGIEEARATLEKAYGVLERRMANRQWIVEEFSIADCAAAPALFYADMVAPFSKTHAQLLSYFNRLADRPSFQRLIAEARPWFQMYPFKERIPRRFLEG